MVIASWVSVCAGALAGALVAANMVIESTPAAVRAVATREFIFGLMKRSNSLRSSTGAYGVSCRARGADRVLGQSGRRRYADISPRFAPAGAAPLTPPLQWVP